MLNDATRLVNAVSNRIDKNLKSGAGIEITYAQVYDVSGQECSVYLAGSREIATAMGEVIEPLSGFRIPGLILVHPEDHVKVSIDSRGHRWVEDVIPLVYPKLAIDSNNGGIFTGDGITAPPWIPFSAGATGAKFIGACLNLSVPVDTEDGVEILVPWDTVEYDTDGLTDLGENGFVIPVGLGGFWRLSALVTIAPESEEEVLGHLIISSGSEQVVQHRARPEMTPAGPILSLSASKIVRAIEGTTFTSLVMMEGGGAGSAVDGAFQEDTFQSDTFQFDMSGVVVMDGQIAPLEDTPDYTMFFKAEYRGPFAPVTVESDSFTANAVLRSPPGGAFDANAVLKKAVSGSFTADAVFDTFNPPGWSGRPGTYETNHAQTGGRIIMGDTFDVPALGGDTLSWRIVGTDFHGFDGYPAGGTGGTRMIRFVNDTTSSELGMDIVSSQLPAHGTGNFDISGSFSLSESNNLAAAGTLSWAFFNGDNRESWSMTITYAEIWPTSSGPTWGPP